LARKLGIEWTKHIKPGLDDDGKSKKKSFEEAVRNSTLALSRLRDIIKSDMEETNRKRAREDSFETGDWAYKQAYMLGKESAHRRLLELLSFLDHGENNVR
jgi:hypothetical protein